MNADRVKALILDCDGVLFDINEAKTLAFEETVKDYPDDKVALFVENHRQTGGVSRYEKFSWFFKELCPSSQPDQDIQKALVIYGDIVQRAYRQIKPVALAVRFVQKMSGQIPVFVASGSDQEELRTVFEFHEFANYFTQILGSPISKTKNVQTLLSEYNFQPEDVIFIGDGGGDYQTTMTLKLPFIYLGAMSEWRPSQGEIDAHPKMWVRRDWQEIMEDFNVQE